MLKDRIDADITRVFMNQEHFAEEHTWNGRKFVGVVDEENALKRRNNNVVDISWSENTGEVMVYAPVKDFPGRVQPNEHVLLNGKPMKVLQVQRDVGMYTIMLASNDPKAVMM